MFEREHFTPEMEEEYLDQFDRRGVYWEKAVSEGRASRSAYFIELFKSPQTEAYRLTGDFELLLEAAKALNETWIGVNHEGRFDTHNVLPASTTTSSTTTSGRPSREA